jgi:hypothetical protein
MKRMIGTVAMTLVGASLFAQANFNIRRPADGSTVKEKVMIRFPKGSVGPNGYVGIFLDGQLIEARRPLYMVTRDRQGKVTDRFLYYLLDTKGRNIPDTPRGQWTELKAVYFDEAGERSRIVDESSVRIRIANRTSIPIPAGGFALRYTFRPDTQLRYRIDQRVVINSITEQQNRLGGRAAELPIEGETIRMLYSVDDTGRTVYGGRAARTALLRMQPLPQRGKDYADLTVVGQSEPRRYFDYEMAPIYMQVTDTGRQLWGSIPPYVPFEGTGAGGSRLDLYASFPLPTLPERRVRPGDTWQSRFQEGAIDLEKLHEVTSVVRSFPATGSFVGVEWEAGEKCVKFKNTIAVGEKSVESAVLQRAGASFLNDAKISVDETVWFSIDTGRVLKVVRDQTVEVRGDTSQIGLLGLGLGSAQGGASAPGGGGGFSGGRPGGAPFGPGGAGGFQPGDRRGSRDDDDRSLRPGTDESIDLRQGGRPGGFPGTGMQGPGGMPFGPGGMGAPGGRGGFPGQIPGGPGGRFGAPNVAEQAFLRIRIQRVFTLER